MKYVLMTIATAWGATILEQSRPDILPAGTLLLPVVIINMLWRRTAGGVFAGGVILILDWIVRPQGLPLVPVGLTFGATLMLVHRASDDPWTGKRVRRLKLPEWTQPTLLAVVGIGLLTGPTMIGLQTGLVEAMRALGAYAMISLPLSLLLTGLMKLAGEFGLRRSM